MSAVQIQPSVSNAVVLAAALGDELDQPMMHQYHQIKDFARDTHKQTFDTAAVVVDKAGLPDLSSSNSNSVGDCLADKMRINPGAVNGESRITEEMISLIHVTTQSVIPIQHGSQSPLKRVPLLKEYIKDLLLKSGITSKLIGVIYIYLCKVKAALPLTAKGLPCTPHRLFTAALVLAWKFTSDHGIKNLHWSRVSGIFCVSEINLIERQFLSLLQYRLSVSDGEYYDYLSQLDRYNDALRGSFKSLPLSAMLLASSSREDQSMSDNVSVVSSESLISVPDMIDSNSR
ncbi:hypothetical protein MIR68_000472 [Amoeboaphelidium protococcarum]|nr:hypothetical protein MIR68_000472 [Amoeboaphelidium protococcarum]